MWFITFQWIFSHGVTLFFLNTLHDKDESLSVYKPSTEAVKSLHEKDLVTLFCKDRLSGTCSGRLPLCLSRYAAYYWRGSCCCLYLSTNYMEIWMLPTTKHQSCDEGDGNKVLLLMVSPGTKSGTVLLLIWQNENASDLLLTMLLICNEETK